jgi:multidrug resistance efflux pump
MKRKRIIPLAILAAAVAAVSLYVRATNPDGRLEGSGTVEARNIRVGSKVGGRVLEVKAREGDRVEAGQVLVTFEDQELLAQLEQARANLEKMDRGYRVEEIAEAQAAAARARAAYEEMRRGYRPEQVEAARAEVERATAEAVRTEATWRRVSDLANADVFSKQQRDDAEGAYRAAVAARQAAEQRLRELERGYRIEQVQAAEAAWKQAEARRLQYERGYRREDVEQARAVMRDAEARYRERQVTAPAAATVEVLDVRPGDLIAPNVPLAVLLERDQLYVRIYVPETQIGLVRVGQKAAVRVDSFPRETFEAEVEQVNQKAEFLPRNVQTRAERVHQMFGVKLRIHDPQGKVRAGMAADVTLQLK